MTRINIQIKPLLVAMIAVFLVAMIINNYTVPQSLADKASKHKQTRDQQDFSTCVNKSLDKILNGYLNFSDPDPISHCYDQLFKGNIDNGNGTYRNGRGNNNVIDNSTFYDV
jgi:hypothetical protein